MLTLDISHISVLSVLSVLFVYEMLGTPACVTRVSCASIDAVMCLENFSVLSKILLGHSPYMLLFNKHYRDW